MMKFFLVLLVLISGVVNTTFAQDSDEVEKITPELPGEILIDFGFNLSTNQVDTLNFNWFRSKSVSIYYVRSFELGKKLTFRPGIGVGLDKLGSKQGVTIDYITDADNRTSVAYKAIPGQTVKSQIAMNFAEIPLELRYNFSGNKDSGSIYIALGGTIGYAFDIHTKEKYEFQGEKFKVKRKNAYGVQQLRYSANARVGIGKFSVFYRHYLTTVFNNAPTGMGDLRYATVGISVSGF